MFPDTPAPQDQLPRPDKTTPRVAGSPAGQKTPGTTAPADRGPQLSARGLRRLQAVVATWVREDRGSTHWQGCEVVHSNCAMAEAADALRAAAELAASHADLLAALKAIVDDAVGDDSDPLHIVQREFIDQARAAIQKAEAR